MQGRMMRAVRFHMALALAGVLSPTAAGQVPNPTVGETIAESYDSDCADDSAVNMALSYVRPLPPCCECAAEMMPFEHRVEMYPDRDSHPWQDNPIPDLPPSFRPWWDPQLASSLRGDAAVLNVTLDHLVLGALAYAPRVLAVAADTESRQTFVAEQWGRFDWRGFLEMTYDDRSDPVGSLLETGDPDITRLRDNQWIGDYGFRRENPLGGEFEINQRLGFQDTNSEFFVPKNQGTARLEVSYAQPLLNQAGRAYNTSRIVVAQIDGDIARDEFQSSVQDHLLDVAETYWGLYRDRAVYLQKHKLLASAESILETLRARQRVDAVQRQVLRARSAVASRRSEIARASMMVRNGESRIRLLVNDPQLVHAQSLELVPRDAPHCRRVPVSLRGSLQTALQNRPDIGAALRDIRAATVRTGVAENELLPKLDLLLSVYSAGLEGNQRINQAFINQFSQLEPGYSVGMLLEVPLGNQTARARYQRRRLEFRRAVMEFRDTVETGLTEVELAARELETSYQELGSKYQAMIAAEEEARYLDHRWRLLPSGDGSTAQLLEDLLDAQERLADQEEGFVAAQVSYALAMIQLKRSMGTLLRFINEGCYEEPLPPPEHSESEEVPAVASARRLPQVNP
jgi:outer membrane protein TolC